MQMIIDSPPRDRAVSTLRRGRRRRRKRCTPTHLRPLVTGVLEEKEGEVY